MRGWFITEMVFPISGHKDATMTSVEAPASSALVAVCSECTSWSTAKPTTRSSSWASMARTRSAMVCSYSMVSTMICCHSADVDSSIRVKVTLQSSRRAVLRGQHVEHVGGRHAPVIGHRVAPHRLGSGPGQTRHEAERGAHRAQELAPLGRGREVLVFGGHHDLGPPEAGGEPCDDRL